MTCRGSSLQAFAAGRSFLTNGNEESQSGDENAEAGPGSAGGRVFPAALQLCSLKLVREVLVLP